MSRVTHPFTGEIDWSELRARVAKAFDASREALQPSPKQAREILDERARQLSRPGVESGPPIAKIEVLSFTLGGELYGLETIFVREVIRVAEFTSIARVPDFVIGITNLRGDIIPVFDLKRFFGFPSERLIEQPRVIAIGTVATEFGIVADAVHAVSTIPVDDILPDSILDGDRGTGCVRGVTRDAMIVLNGAALMNDQQLFISSSRDAS